MDIAGLVFTAVAEVKPLITSIKERYSNFKESPKVLHRLELNIEGIERQMEACSGALENISKGASQSSVIILKGQFKTIEERFESAKSILQGLQSGVLSNRKTGLSRWRLLGKLLLRIATAKSVAEQLNTVSSDFEQIPSTLLSVTAVLENLKLKSTFKKVAASGADKRLGISSVPALTDREVLNYDGQDEHGNPMPEAQLKQHILDDSLKISTATGRSQLGRLCEIPSAEGMAGTGKSIALIGLASDPDIKQRFKEIHFISLGHDASDKHVVSELAKIVRISGGKSVAESVQGSKDVQEAVRVAAGWFSESACLFLVDDVWRTEDKTYGYLPILRQLLCSCDGSRMAISTRERRISLEAGRRVEFGARGATTSRCILLNHMRMSEALPSERTGKNIKKILDLCAGLPLALAVAGYGARELMSHLDCGDKALDHYVLQLGRKHASLLAESSAGYRSLKSAMQVSLGLLDKDESKEESARIGDTYRRMYTGLCVMKAQAWAPTSMLSCLWRLNMRQTEHVMRKLCNLHLASMQHRSFMEQRSNSMQEGFGLRLHDLQLQFCQELADMDGTRREWHEQLLNGYSQLENATNTNCSDRDTRNGSGDPFCVKFSGAEHAPNKRHSIVEPRVVIRRDETGQKHVFRYRAWWSEQIVDDGYIYENIARHLVEAGKHDELQAVLLDARWTKHRIQVGGILGLEADFAELLRKQNEKYCKTSRSRVEKIAEDFRVILNALRCSWHYATANERELPVQASARLLGLRKSSNFVKQYVKSVMKYSERPFVESLSPFLPDARNAQIGEFQLGGGCLCIDYSTCGRFIAAGADNDVVIVDTATLEVLSCFNGHASTVRSVCFLPHSDKVVSGSDDHTVKVWDMSKPKDEPLTLEGDSRPITSVCVSNDGTRVAAGSFDEAVYLWDLREGANKRRILRGHKEHITCVCFSPDGTQLASGSYDKTIRWWDGRTGEATGATVEVGLATSISYSPDGRTLVSGLIDGTLRVWDAKTRGSVGKVLEGHSDQVNSISFNADGSRILSASLDRTVRIWDSRTCTAVGAVVEGHTDAVFGAKFSSDGTRVMSGSADGMIRIWDTRKHDSEGKSQESHSGRVACVAFSAGGGRIATGSWDNTIRIWDARSGVAVCKPLQGHSSAVRCIAFSPDELRLASGSDDCTVRVWDVMTGSPLFKIVDGHADGVQYIAFSADGALVVSGSWKTVLALDARTGLAVGKAFRWREETVSAVGFSEDGTKIVSAFRDLCRSDRAVFILAARSGDLLWTSERLNDDSGNALSDAEAQAIINSSSMPCEVDPATNKGSVILSHESAVDVADVSFAISFNDGAVMMKQNGINIRLVRLPELALDFIGKPWEYFSEKPWQSFPDRSEFVLILSNGVPAVFKLHF